MDYILHYLCTSDWSPEDKFKYTYIPPLKKVAGSSLNVLMGSCNGSRPVGSIQNSICRVGRKGGEGGDERACGEKTMSNGGRTG